MLEGEEGVGKSSLLRAATRDAKDQGYTTIEGRPQASELPQPFHLLHELLNSLAAHKERNAASKEGLKGLAAFGLVRPFGRDRGALPMGLVPFGSSLESPEKTEERLLAALSSRKENREEEKRELFDSLVDRFDELAAEKKLLLVIDDLHYADHASMDFLGYLCRRTAGKNLKIMAACRPEAEVPEILRSIIAGFGQERLLHRLEVKPLTEKESMEFLAHLSKGQKVTEAVAGEWFVTSRGNPLVLTQLFRGGVSSADASSEKSVRASAVFDKFSEEERKALLHASVIGKSFRFQLLYQCLGGDEEKLVGMVESLTHSGILKDRGSEVYEFSNEELWKAAYGFLSESRRRILHRKVAEAYEKLYPNPPPDVIPEMGRQFYLAKVHDKSLLYNRYAATQATNAFYPEVAIFYLERALEDIAALSGTHRLEEADVLRELGDLYYATGDTVRADQQYGESISRLPEEETTLRALVLLSRADALREMDQMEAVRSYCNEAIQILAKAGHKKGLAMAHHILSREATKRCDFEMGRKEIEATLALLDPEKDAREVGRCYIDLGNAYAINYNDADQARSIECYHKAMETLEPLHDYKELFRVHNNIASAMALDDPRGALEELKKAREYAEKSKSRRDVGWTLFNGVEMLVVLGEMERAAQDNEAAYRILFPMNDPYAMQQIVNNRGIIAQHRKDYREAEKFYLEAGRMAEKLQYPDVQVEAHLRLASLYADEGRSDEARKELSSMEVVGADKLVYSLKSVHEDLKRRLLAP